MNVNDGCCGPGPYGIVQLVNNGTNQVDFTVTLNSGYNFVATGNNPESFAFNIGNPPAAANLLITVNTAGFSLLSGAPFDMDGFGNFQYAIGGLDNGAGHSVHGPLSFTVKNTASGGTLSTSQFESVLSSNPPGNLQSLFAADIYVTACGSASTIPSGQPGAGQSCTGIVGTSSAPAVPEPTSIAFFGTGLLVVGYGLRRKFTAQR